VTTVKEEVREASLAVLARNWRGAFTRAAPRLYPHQWSWDSACVALALAHYRQAHAEAELLSLFAGQWDNGLLPHIRFFDEDASYFPGPELWESRHSPHAPKALATSGIVQPPVHATAVLHQIDNAPDEARALRLARVLYPKLVAWHRYLHVERVRSGSALVELWHPWESGMDNSPLWDGALERLLPPGDGPDYRRVDTTIADPRERPTDWEYDRYVYLVSLQRDLAYDPAAVRDMTPFAVRDVLFNSLLARADEDLATIARRLGEDPSQAVSWADDLRSAINAEMWSPEHRLYLDVDVISGSPIEICAASGLAPLFARACPPDHVASLLDTVERFSVSLADGASVLASLATDDPHFDPRCYWRGPVWPMLNWVVSSGFQASGGFEVADRLTSGFVQLVHDHGAWEQFSPLDGHGQGCAEVSWTAGLALDSVTSHEFHDELTTKHCQ
jgi:hypothetical protein